jgi:hypothetical protein
MFKIELGHKMEPTCQFFSFFLPPNKFPWVQEPYPQSGPARVEWRRRRPPRLDRAPPSISVASEVAAGAWWLSSRPSRRNPIPNPRKPSSRRPVQRHSSRRPVQKPPRWTVLGVEGVDRGCRWGMVALLAAIAAEPYPQSSKALVAAASLEALVVAAGSEASTLDGARRGGCCAWRPSSRLLA